MEEKKKRIKKTKKQSGGLSSSNNVRKFYNGLLEKLSSSPLATIFRIGRPKKNWTTFIRNTSNKVLREQDRLNYITKIKGLLLSDNYIKNVPVFYGNQLKKNNQKSIGYNEYICRKILGRFGVISSKRRIFIINPFAEYVYSIAIFCTNKKYMSEIKELNNLLKKLLKLDDFTGFPEITYLPYRTPFCILKDSNGLEKVITPSVENNYSRCNLVSVCSLMMTAEIREENLPSEEDIIELYNIIKYNPLLLNFSNYLTLQNNYFEGICELLLKLNHLKNIIIKLSTTNIQPIGSNQRIINQRIINQQQNARKSIILTLNEILSLNTNISGLTRLYDYVKSQLNQPNVNLLEVSIQLINQIKTLLKSDPITYHYFLLFLDTKKTEKNIILQIL